jgi:hypothetical protein
MDKYEIRRSGQVICSGSVKNLGYSDDTLKGMYRDGMYLYKNGKKVAKPWESSE